MPWARYLLLSVLAVASAACAVPEVKRSAGEQIDDTILLSRVKTALLGNDQTDGMAIDVEVFRGRVQLNGTAGSEDKKQAATAVARAVPGVEEVENNLRVVTGSRRTGEYLDDKVLEARVATALARADGVNAFDVEVEVERGVVSLGGFVNSSAERRRAEEIAAEVEYTRRVVNNISIR